MKPVSSRERCGWLTEAIPSCRPLRRFLFRKSRLRGTTGWGGGLCKRESRRRSNIRCMVGQKSAGWAHVCCSPHETGAAGCPCRLAIWYCFGEIPNWAEKALVRWLGLENPHRYAISVMFFPFSLRSLRAHSRRSRRRMPKTVSSKSILNKAVSRVRLTPTAAASSGKLGGFPISWSSMA